MNILKEFEYMNEPILNDMELQSSTWLKLKAHLEQRLDAKRRENDGPLDNDKTQRLRGCITELKYILSLELTPKPKPREYMEYNDFTGAGY